MIRLQQNSFFGGQLDYEMMGRQDYQRYAKGATKLKNFNVMKRGGLDKRRGFDRILNLVEEFGANGVQASTKFRAIPYAYKKTQGFVLLMSGPKCVVVGTSSSTQFKYYNIDDLDGVYTAQEVEELDYQQCGDILFLAHQNHPPARIVHDIDGSGEHGFHYETIDIGASKKGIPSITDSLCTRCPVTTDEENSASIKVEEYKVAAVFDGVETRPCSAYKKKANPTTVATRYRGTDYRMPWTESQKIRLTIQPVVRSRSDGTLEYPQEVRVYKKAFNYFGLIGSVRISDPSSLRTGSTTSIHIGEYHQAPLQNMADDAADDTSVDVMNNTDAEYTPPPHGYGLIGYRFSDGTVLSMSNFDNVGAGYVRIFIGSCWYNKHTEDGVVTSIDMNYSGCVAVDANAAMFAKVYANPSSPPVGVKEFKSTGDITKVITKGEAETTEAFEARFADEFSAFASSIADMNYIDIPFTGLNSATLYIQFSNCIFTGNCFRVYNTPSTLLEESFDDDYITPDASMTPIDDTEDVPMSANGDYPASVSLSQQRLIWASSVNDPARIWMSAVGDFYSYETHEIMTHEDSIDFMLPITRFGTINHICEMRKLLLFNSACEWLVDSASSVQGLTYETIQAYPQSYSGSSTRLKPIICNNSLIFCERTGQAVRRFAYDISNDGFAGRDVSILSASIFEFNSIVDWTYQQFPYSTLWCAMRNGTMASFEYMEEQDIMAWLTHELGGGGECVCLATSYAVSPAMDEVTNEDEYEYATHEEIFAVVRRQGSLWLERMRPRAKTPVDNMAAQTDSLYHCLCMDGVRVLNSLNNYQPTEEEGAVWIPADTTDGSTITRDEALAKLGEGVEVYEGFPFDAVYTSVYPNINNGGVGNGQFDIKLVQGCAFRLMHSFGGKVKPVGAHLYEPIQYFYNDPENDHRTVFKDGNVTLHNHDTIMMSLCGVNNRDGRVTVVQDEPYPFSVLSYEIDFEPETGGPR